MTRRLSDAAVAWRTGRGSWARPHPGVYLTAPGRDDGWTRALAAQLAVDGSAWSHRTAAANETFALLGRAFQRRRTSEAVLRSRLALRTRHPRRSLLPEVLSDVADGAESAMEVRYLRDVERAHRLPVGVRQVARGPYVHDVGYLARGPYVHDVGYLAQGVLVELDGRLGHETAEDRVRDGVRDRRGAGSGWLTVRASWRDVAGAPCALAGGGRGARASGLGRPRTRLPPGGLRRPWPVSGRVGSRDPGHRGSRGGGRVEQESAVARSPARMNRRRAPD